MKYAFPQCGDDFPELEFEYEDTESHMNEIAELYSYTEVPEFQTNLRVSPPRALKIILSAWRVLVF